MDEPSNEIVERHISLRATHLASVALLALYAASWALSYASLGRASFLVALAIAFAKALIVAFVFMELATERFSIQATALAAAAMVTIFITLTVLDITTRAESPLVPPPLEPHASRLPEPTL